MNSAHATRTAANRYWRWWEATSSVAPMVLCLIAAAVRAPAAEIQTVPEIAAKLGYNADEIKKIQKGDIVRSQLKEITETELAGVVTAFFPRPVSELSDSALNARFLGAADPAEPFRGWAADASPDAVFADLGLTPMEAGEAERYVEAKAGDELNLSAAEIQQFRHGPHGLAGINTTLRQVLKARYEAYRHCGLGGVAPYARGEKELSSPGDELRSGINETMSAARQQDFFQSLLNYPTNALPAVQHRFYWFKQIVEDRPTFILAHRSEFRLGDTASLVSEEQFYVSHSYNANFVTGACVAVEGGTLVFYVNRTFTDQVTGFASGMRHSIGRKKMLAEVAANLRRIRDQLKSKPIAH